MNKGVLEALDDYIAKDGVDLSQYGGITDQVTVDGKLYELPFRSDFWVMFYNKDVFDNAGVSYPTNDMTFEQYDALARSVTNDTPGQEVYGAHYHTWRSAVQLFGILDGKNSIVDGNYEFLKPYYEMILAQQEDGVCQDYATLKTSSLHYSGAFAQGNVAMMNMGSWFIPTLIEKLKRRRIRRGRLLSLSGDSMRRPGIRRRGGVQGGRRLHRGPGAHAAFREILFQGEDGILRGPDVLLRDGLL